MIGHTASPLGVSGKYTVSRPLCIGFAGGRHAAQRPPFGRSLLRGVRAWICSTPGAANSAALRPPAGGNLTYLRSAADEERSNPRPLLSRGRSSPCSPAAARGCGPAARP